MMRDSIGFKIGGCTQEAIAFSTGRFQLPKKNDHNHATLQ
jgi:hypothetical protein